MTWELSSPDGPMIQRCLAAEAGPDPELILPAQLSVIMDEHIANVLRGMRTGHGKTLRDLGFAAIADELDLWDIPVPDAVEKP